MAVVFITHDLGVIAEVADRVVVMYAGQVAEQSTVQSLFEKPLHPYTQGLLKAIPRLGAAGEGRLNVIEGSVPVPTDFPRGCRFHPRCPKRFGPCDQEEPPLLQPESGRQVRCLLYDERFAQQAREKQARKK